MASIHGAQSQANSSRTQTFWFVIAIYAHIFVLWNSNWRNDQREMMRRSTDFTQICQKRIPFIIIYLLYINFSSVYKISFILLNVDWRTQNCALVCASDTNMKWLYRFVLDISKLRQNERSLVYVTLLNNELWKSIIFFCSLFSLLFFSFFCTFVLNRLIIWSFQQKPHYTL